MYFTKCHICLYIKLTGRFFACLWHVDIIIKGSDGNVTRTFFTFQGNRIRIFHIAFGNLNRQHIAIPVLIDRRSTSAGSIYFRKLMFRITIRNIHGIISLIWFKFSIEFYAECDIFRTTYSKAVQAGFIRINIRGQFTGYILCGNRKLFGRSGFIQNYCSGIHRLCRVRLTHQWFFSFYLNRTGFIHCRYFSFIHSNFFQWDLIVFITNTVKQLIFHTVRCIEIYLRSLCQIFHVENGGRRIVSGIGYFYLIITIFQKIDIISVRKRCRRSCYFNAASQIRRLLSYHIHFLNLYGFNLTVCLNIVSNIGICRCIIRDFASILVNQLQCYIRPVIRGFVNLFCIFFETINGNVFLCDISGTVFHDYVVGTIFLNL